MTKKESAREMGEALTRLRAQAGAPSIRSIERALVMDLGADLAPSDEQLRRMFDGQVSPYTCSVESLIGLARYFHVGPDGLGSAAAHRLRTVLSYLSDGDRDSGCIPGWLDVLDGGVAQLSLFGGAEPTMAAVSRLDALLYSTADRDRRHHEVPVSVDRRHALGLAA